MNNILETNLLFTGQKIKFFDDCIIGKSLKQQGCWEIPLSEYFIGSSIFYNSWCKDFIFLDLGAHVGYYSLLCSYFAPRSITHSFEPNPDVFELLNLNVCKVKNIISYNNAISKVSGDCAFYYYGEETGGGSLDANCLNPTWDKKTTICHQIALKDLKIEWNKVKMIKIDVQGKEVEVIENLFPLISSDCTCFVEKEQSIANFLFSNEKLFSVFGFIGNAIVFNKK